MEKGINKVNERILSGNQETNRDEKLRDKSRK